VPTFVAVDLGATSGRTAIVEVDGDGLRLETVDRFPTPTVAGPEGSLAWDVDAVLASVRRGLVAAAARGPVASVAVDSWAVDYGLLDADGRLVGPVHAYRSSRTDGVMDAVRERVGAERIYGVTGIQFLPFNTAYQLVAARGTAEYAGAVRLLMVPDLVGHALCGATTNDVTNASTTQLLDVRRRTWSDDLVAALGLRRGLLPPLHEPGTHLGPIRGVDPSVDGVPLVAAASHDTASAFVGTPWHPDRPAVSISCGTWSLVGCEIGAPVTSRAALAANVTNELGVGGTVRLLKNVTGLWLLEECRRTWAATGTTPSVAELAAAAAELPGGTSVVDPDDPRFAAPGDMPARIAAACRATGQPVPATPAELTRTILDSLAVRWRTTVRVIETIAGVDAVAVHLVGGGSAIPLLRDLCASACERPVLAGPTEATVAGNAIVQAVAAGTLADVDHGRRLVERSLQITRVDPRSTLDWDALMARVDGAAEVPW
jgi:rhamnulokinase